MKQFICALIISLGLTFSFWWIVKLRGLTEQKRLKDYYTLINQLESKGFDYKEAQYIALIESGYRKPDSLYYEYLNHQKRVIKTKN